jgi:hypothetical protein
VGGEDIDKEAKMKGHNFFQDLACDGKPYIVLSKCV